MGKVLICFAFLVLGFSAFSRSSITRNISVSELLSSTNNGNYTVQGEVVSLSESGVILRDAQGVEVRVFGQNDKLVPGASGSLLVNKQGDTLSIAKFIPAVGKSESGSLEGLRYNTSSGTLYGNVRTEKSIGWVSVSKDKIYSVQN